MVRECVGAADGEGMGGCSGLLVVLNIEVCGDCGRGANGDAEGWSSSGCCCCCNKRCCSSRCCCASACCCFHCCSWEGLTKPEFLLSQ